MKKKIAVTCIVFLAISFSFFFYKQIISKTFRYQTPAEVFSNSNQSNSELIDILEEKDVALLIYKNKNGTYSDHITAKDSDGWTPLSINYKSSREIFEDNGFIYLKEVDGKYVVQVVLLINPNETLPEISDSINSDFLLSSFEFDDKRKLLYGFLVSEDKFPDNYKIMIGSKEISIY